MPKKIKKRHSKPGSNPAVSRQEIKVSHQEYSGPIPRASDLQAYEDIKAGFAERIVKMAENEATHRQRLDYKVINSERIFNIFGQLIAACMGFSVIVLMWYAFRLGYAEQVKWIGISIVSVVGLFIYKR